MQVNKVFYEEMGASRWQSVSRAIENIRELRFLEEATLHFDYFVPITPAESDEVDVFMTPSSKNKSRRRIQIGFQVKIKEPEWEIDTIEAATDDVVSPAIENTAKTYFGVDNLLGIARETFAEFVLSRPPALVRGGAVFLAKNKTDANELFVAFSKGILELHKALRVDRPIERIHPKTYNGYEVDVGKMANFGISLEHCPGKGAASEFWDAIRGEDGPTSIELI